MPINIQHIIKNSNSEFLKSLPSIFVKAIAIIIKQKELNMLFDYNSEYIGVDFPPKVIEYLNVKLDIKGKENLPDNGRCFFVANHIFGFLDGLALASIVGEKYGDLRIIGNNSLNHVESLRPIITNVNVFGKNNRQYLMELKKLYASDIPITSFPAGIVSRIRKLKIKDIDWKKSFIKKAIENKRDIVPIRFVGRNSFLFYFIYIFRQIFRIKTNIELSLLPREMFKKRNKTIKIIIGKPISYKTFDKTLSHKEWAQKVSLQVYKLN